MKLREMCREVLLQLQPFRPSERVEMEVRMSSNGEVVDSSNRHLAVV